MSDEPHPPVSIPNPLATLGNQLRFCPRVSLSQQMISSGQYRFRFVNLLVKLRERLEGRKGTKLIEKTVERTDAEDMPAASGESTSPDVPSSVDAPTSGLMPGSDEGATRDRRDRRSRRVAAAEPVDINAR